MNTVITRLEGGLGNIMFQYALGRYLSLKNGARLKFDVSSCKVNLLGDYSLSLELFNINIEENIATDKEIKLFEWYKIKSGRQWFLYNLFFADTNKYIKEKWFHFDPEILKLRGDIYLNGWWQTEKYFNTIREQLLNDFTVREPLSGRNKYFSEKITATNSISIHFRRLDYVKNKKTRNYHGELSKEYYKEALGIIVSKVKNPVFFIFSDDPLWVQENISFPLETVYVLGNDPMESPHEDMRLMSLCKHNIIANSSFSWWGAWLNQNKEKIVIAPNVWLAEGSKKNNSKDVVPENWVTLNPHYNT